jgi:hypothetical protein
MEEIFELIFERNKVVYVFLTFFSILGVSYFSAFIFGANTYEIIIHISFSIFVTLVSALFTANKLADAKVKKAS